MFSSVYNLLTLVIGVGSSVLGRPGGLPGALDGTGRLSVVHPGRSKYRTAGDSTSDVS